jgi:hypothetical protein
MPKEPAERRVDYDQKKESGLCPRCGQKKGKRDKFAYCSECREYFRNYNQEMSDKVNEIRKSRYDQRKSKNQCPRCGVKHGKKYPNIICMNCLEKQYMYNKKSKTVTKKNKKTR